MAEDGLKYSKVLLKLSGEALAGDRGFGIEPSVVDRLTDEVKVWVTEPGQYDFALCDPFHPTVWVTGVEVRADRENIVTFRLRPVEGR